VSERSKRISRLLESAASRASYIRAKLSVLIPSQIRALRLKQENMTQKQLAALAGMAQPRISAMERPGETTFNIDTLVRLASAFKVGLKVEFVPFSEMLEWENKFSQDGFNPTPIHQDREFLSPRPIQSSVTLNPSLRVFAEWQRAFARNIGVLHHQYAALAGSENILAGEIHNQIIVSEPSVQAGPVAGSTLTGILPYQLPMSVIAADASANSYIGNSIGG